MKKIFGLVGDMIVAFIVVMFVFGVLGMIALGGFMLAWMVSVFFPVDQVLVYQIIVIVSAFFAIVVAGTLARRDED